MILAALLLMQASIVPMTMDSVRPVGDSVEYVVRWGYDSAFSTAPAVDSIRLWWQKAPNAARTRKLAGSARTVTVRFYKRSGRETALRTVCLRYWTKLTPTMRCVSKLTDYLAMVVLKPDSVTLTVPPPPLQAAPKKL